MLQIILLEVDSTTILVSLFINLISALFFLFILLFLLRPSIKISPIIAKEIEDNKSCYVIKVVNKSLFSAYDVNVSVDLKKSIPAGNGRRHVTINPVSLKRSYYPCIPAFSYRPDNTCPYAFQIVIRDVDLEKIDTTVEEISFEITLKHGLSGLSKMKNQTFVKADIKPGAFRHGNSLELI